MSYEVRIVGDPGSCHLGKFENAIRLIDIGVECCLDAIKFQLFPAIMAGHNVPLPYTWLPKLVEYGKCCGIEVFASVFNEAAYKIVRQLCARIKFSYGSPVAGLFVQARKGMGAENVIISGDVMNPPPAWAVKLYCIPEYPVKYKIDFEGLFHGRFDGFSDHTLGYQQTIRAVQCGATMIEKHFRLDNPYCDTVPDGKFALKPKDLATMVGKIRWNLQ